MRNALDLSETDERVLLHRVRARGAPGAREVPERGIVSADDRRKAAELLDEALRRFRTLVTRQAPRAPKPAVYDSKSN